MNVGIAMDHLRDHGDDPYRPDSHFLMKRICAHSAYPVSRHSAQTTGSLIAHLKKNTCAFWATGTAAPCTSLFKPIWFTEKGLPDLGAFPSGAFTPNSLWWRHELLHRSVLLDFNHRLSLYQEERNRLENEFIGIANKADSSSQWEISNSAFKKCEKKIGEWSERVLNEPIRQHGNSIYRSYWKKQNKKAGIVVA